VSPGRIEGGSGRTEMTLQGVLFVGKNPEIFLA